MERAETLPDNNLRVSQKPETTTAVIHEQLSLWSSVVPSSLSEDHPLQAGPDTGLNIRLGADVIQALNNGVPVTLQLNPEGGGVVVTGDIVSSGKLEAGTGLSVADESMRGLSKVIDGGPSTTINSSSWAASNDTVEELGLTFTAPNSGSVYFLFSAKLSINPAGVRAILTIELFENDASGLEIIAANSTRAIECSTSEVVTNQFNVGTSILVPGQTYYVRMTQRMAATTSTGTIWGRSLAILPRL
jgi:hypothetical protein